MTNYWNSRAHESLGSDEQGAGWDDTLLAELDLYGFSFRFYTPTCSSIHAIT
jgi:hypothetical protein